MSYFGMSPPRHAQLCQKCTSEGMYLCDFALRHNKGEACTHGRKTPYMLELAEREKALIEKVEAELESRRKKKTDDIN